MKPKSNLDVDQNLIHIFTFLEPVWDPFWDYFLVPFGINLGTLLGSVWDAFWNHFPVPLTEPKGCWIHFGIHSESILEYIPNQFRDSFWIHFGIHSGSILVPIVDPLRG